MLDLPLTVTVWPNASDNLLWFEGLDANAQVRQPNCYWQPHKPRSTAEGDVFASPQELLSPT